MSADRSEMTSTGVVAALVAAVNHLIEGWDEFSALNQADYESLAALVNVVEERLEPLRAAADQVIPDDLHAWCVTADQYEDERTRLAAAHTVIRRVVEGWSLRIDNMDVIPPFWENDDGEVDLTPAEQAVLDAAAGPNDTEVTR